MGQGGTVVFSNVNHQGEKEARMTITHSPAVTSARAAQWHDPVFQAFWLLRSGFTVAPILFGLDKFVNRLVDWPVRRE